MDGEHFVITTPYVTKMTIDWAHVKSIESQSPHIVRLKSDQFINARFVKTPTGMQLESDELRTVKPVAPNEIATIDIPPGAQWAGQLALSIGGTQGNYPHNFAVGGRIEAARRTDQDRLRLGVAGEYGETQDIKELETRDGVQYGTKVQPRSITTSNVRGWGLYDYNFDPHWSLGGQVKLEHDDIKDLNLRTTVGIAPRYRVYDTKTQYLSFYVGPAFIDEQYIEDTSQDRSFISLALGDELHWKFPWGFSVDQTLDIYPNLQDTSDVLFSFALAPRYTIAEGLFAGLTFNWDYDTQPAHFRERNDFRYLANVGWEF
jgi:hypothetical protein